MAPPMIRTLNGDMASTCYAMAGEVASRTWRGREIENANI